MKKKINLQKSGGTMTLTQDLPSVAYKLDAYKKNTCNYIFYGFF